MFFLYFIFLRICGEEYINARSTCTVFFAFSYKISPLQAENIYYIIFSKARELYFSVEKKDQFPHRYEYLTNIKFPSHCPSVPLHVCLSDDPSVRLSTCFSASSTEQICVKLGIGDGYKYRKKCKNLLTHKQDLLLTAKVNLSQGSINIMRNRHKATLYVHFLSCCTVPTITK